MIRAAFVVSALVTAFGLAAWGAVAHMTADRAVTEACTAATAAMAVEHDRPDHEPIGAVGVDDSMGGGGSWKVRCPSMDGGTDVDMAVNVDGGVGRFNFTDITISNTSSTCVRVGLDTSVDQNHGIEVGASCAAGEVLPLHSKVARCQSEGPAVVADVTAGRP